MKPRTAVIAATLLLLAASAGADALGEATAAMQRKDWPTALRLLEPLARDGDPVAQWRLGLLHYHGHGVRESDAAAMQWFEKAAKRGLADAQFDLANLYAYGLVAAPPGEDAARLAAKWYFEAARQGHAQAQYSLGILFMTGSGVEVSAEEAEKWIRRAAAQGHGDAQNFVRGKAR